ncbi:MAG: hypothetical protein PHZ24_09075 [Bacteroidales bacterium]|nr:hypothetical protein [Bacteroidales bacterium]
MKKQKQSIFKKVKKWFKIIFILPFAIISFSVGVVILKTSYIFAILSHVIKGIAALLMIEPYSFKSNLKVALSECKEMWSNYI